MKGNVQVMKWCKRISLFMLAVAMVCVLDIFSSVSFASSGKTNSNAKIRKEANPSSTQLGLAEKGTTVEISGESKGTDGKTWYKVSVNNINGYIRSDLIDVSGDSGTTDSGNNGNSGSSTTIDGLEQVVQIEATVSGGNSVRIRTSASTANSNNILTTAANGTKVTVVARTTGSDKKLWYQIKLTVDGNEVMGYIRNDYLTLSGEVKPLTEENVAPQEKDTTPEENKQEEEQTKNTETPTQTKRYDTRFMNDKWYMLDYEANKQYDIDQVFSAAKEFEEKYLTEQAKTKKLKTWLTVFILLAIAGCGTAGYLFYLKKMEKEKEYIDSFGDGRRKHTSERPVDRARETNRPAQQNTGRERPAIRDGLENRKDEGQRSLQNGQRQTNGRPQGGAPRQDAAASHNGQRLNNAQNAQRQGNPQQVQRAGEGQQRVSNGARPAGQQAPQNNQRPAAQEQNRRPQGNAQQARPNAGQQPQAQNANTNRAKNFVQEDEHEFEFRDWDSDDE